jgi:tetratricopeptide (TPR) repeat protein
MLLFFEVEELIPSPSNRVTIYAAQNFAEIRKLYGDSNRVNIGGFYSSNASGTYAIVGPLGRVALGRAPKGLTLSEKILLHEYAHHFLLSASTGVYPRWISEGFAEFCAMATFEKDGSVGIGWPIPGYLRQLKKAELIPIEIVLDTEAYAAIKGDGYDTYYPQSWLLYHFLQFSSSRQGQLTRYLDQLKQGKTEMDAARTAFGDLDSLQLDLERYAKLGQFGALGYAAAGLSPGAVKVRKFSRAEAAILPVAIRSRLGVTLEQAKEVLIKAQKVVKKYPDDPMVLEALSEALVDTDRDEEAIVVADRVIAMNANAIHTHIQKTRALLKLAPDADYPSRAWRAARKQAIAANQIEQDHPMPLIQYYRSYSEAGETPTTNAIDGLQRALALAPFDSDLRLFVAQELARLGRLDEAKDTLAPLTMSSHNADLRLPAKALLEKMQEMADVDGQDLSSGQEADNEP